MYFGLRSKMKTPNDSDYIFARRVVLLVTILLVSIWVFWPISLATSLTLALSLTLLFCLASLTLPVLVDTLLKLGENVWGTVNRSSTNSTNTHKNQKTGVFQMCTLITLCILVLLVIYLRKNGPDRFAQSMILPSCVSKCHIQDFISQEPLVKGQLSHYIILQVPQRIL